MPELKDLGVSVHIIVDDKPLEEYGTEVKEGKKSTCYIASQEGQVFLFPFSCTSYICDCRAILKQFKISIKNDTTYELQLWAFMDGNDTGGLLAYAGKTSSKRGLAVSETSTKPYVFTKLEMTGESDQHLTKLIVEKLFLPDDDTVLASTKKISAKLGVIELRVQRVVTGPSTSIAGSATQIDTQPVHERSKKAGCHRVSYVFLSQNPGFAGFAHYLQTGCCYSTQPDDILISSQIF